MTRTFLDSLERRSIRGYMHIDTAISRSTSDRQQIRLSKVVRLGGQLLASAVAAARTSTAYAPISQSRTGLARDVLLLAPFRIARRRVVVHLHGSALDREAQGLPTWLRRALDWLLGGERTEGIVLTPSLRRCFEPWLPPERIHVVGNLVSPPPAHGEDRLRPERPLRVLFIANINRAKGYRELVGAVRALTAAGVSVELTLAGEPATEDDRRWLARRAGPSIHLAGQVDGERKWELLRAAHVVALPSLLIEGQPVSILEGMAVGAAIVATSSGGIPDTVRDGEEGWLLSQPQDTFHLPSDRRGLIRYSDALQEELERALRSLAQDRDLLGRLMAGALQRFREEFGEEHLVELWMRAVFGGVPARAHGAASHAGT